MKGLKFIWAIIFVILVPVVVFLRIYNKTPFSEIDSWIFYSFCMITIWISSLCDAIKNLNEIKKNNQLLREKIEEDKKKFSDYDENGTE